MQKNGTRRSRFAFVGFELFGVVCGDSLGNLSINVAD